MAIGTPFHERTAALNHSLSWRDWAGYFSAGCYNNFHQPEYAAIRNGAAVIDVSPLYKYWISGRDAETLMDRVMTRHIAKQKVGQVVYTPWCDPAGKVLQEGTVLRHGEDCFQLNAAEPAIRWLRMCSAGLDVQLEDRSREIGALAVQGPRSRDLLAEIDDSGTVRELDFFRHAGAKIAGADVMVSRTGYTGDLGYELWIPTQDTLRVWDVLMDVGRRHGVTPCGILALDVARIEAGFVLIGVDYISAEAAKIPNQLSSPFELGLGWSVKLGRKNKTPFVGREALAREKKMGSLWCFVGLEIEWDPLEELYARAGLMPDLPTVAWREAVPVYAEGRQVGRATSGCWSTLLKKYVALASIEATYARIGGSVRMEITVDYSRRQAPAKVVEPTFFRPERMKT